MGSLTVERALEITRTQIASLMLQSAVMVDAVMNPGTEKPVTLDQLPDIARRRLFEAVDMIAGGQIESPQGLHENWLKDRYLDGWTYGEVLDREKKTSPLLKEWEDLEPHERIKSVISYDIASSLVSDLDSFGAISYTR